MGFDHRENINNRLKLLTLQELRPNQPKAAYFITQFARYFMCHLFKLTSPYQTNSPPPPSCHQAILTIEQQLQIKLQRNEMRLSTSNDIMQNRNECKGHTTSNLREPQKKVVNKCRPCLTSLYNKQAIEAFINNEFNKRMIQFQIRSPINKQLIKNGSMQLKYMLLLVMCLTQDYLSALELLDFQLKLHVRTGRPYLHFLAHPQWRITMCVGYGNCEAFGPRVVMKDLP